MIYQLHIPVLPLVQPYSLLVCNFPSSCRTRKHTLTCLSVCSGDDITSIQQEITMMKECKHKNIVAYFGSYHRCCVFSARPLLMCGIPQIVGVSLLMFLLIQKASGFISQSLSRWWLKLYVCFQEHQAVDLHGVLRRRVSSGYVSWYKHKEMFFELRPALVWTTTHLKSATLSFKGAVCHFSPCAPRRGGNI